MRRGVLLVGALWLASVGSAAPWTNIGPFGGEARALASDASGNIVYELNRRSGVFRSSGGGPWTLAFDAVGRGVTPTRIAVDPQTSRVYVGTTRGLYRSDDTGLTWQALTTDPVIDVTAAGDRLIISVPMGLLRSGDAGATWTNIDSPPSDVQTTVSLVRMDSRVVEHVLAIIAGNLFLSSDLGKSWQQLKAKNVVAAIFGDVIYAAGPSGVYVCDSDCSQIGTDPVVDVAYWHGLVYEAIADGVLRYAPPWQRLVEGFPSAAMLSLLSTPSALLAGTTAGVYSTEDGSRWRTRSEGLTNVRISGIATAGGSLFAATQGQGIMRRDGSVWVDASTGLPSNPPIAPSPRVLATDGSTLYAGFLGSGLLRSTNVGASWDNVSAGLPSRDILDVATDAGIVIAATGSALVRSADRGATWPTFKTYPALLASSVALKGAMVAAASVTNVFVSTDSGATWQAKELPFPIRAVAIAGTRIIASADQGIFVRTDAGWSGPLFATSRINAITAAAGRAYVSIGAPASGIYFTDDGVTWFLVPGSDGLPPDITVLSTDAVFLYAGTNGGSIFATPLSSRRHAAGR